MRTTKYMPLRMALCLQILLLAVAYGGERKRFCGPILTETLQILCRNRYASLRYNNHKRSDRILDDGDDNSYMNEESYNYPLLGYPSFFSGLGSTAALNQRVKRGVFDDCCREPCTTQELMSYCGI